MTGWGWLNLCGSSNYSNESFEDWGREADKANKYFWRPSSHGTTTKLCRSSGLAQITLNSFQRQNSYKDFHYPRDGAHCMTNLHILLHTGMYRNILWVLFKSRPTYFTPRTEIIISQTSFPSNSKTSPILPPQCFPWVHWWGRWQDGRSQHRRHDATLCGSRCMARPLGTILRTIFKMVHSEDMLTCSVRYREETNA